MLGGQIGRSRCSNDIIMLNRVAAAEREGFCASVARAAKLKKAYRSSPTSLAPKKGSNASNALASRIFFTH